MPYFIPIHIAKTFSASTDQCRDASGMRALPECVVLDVAEGVTPSAKPPVRIFLGTEPAQYRAERVFVWSIERVRDPSRVYEIYLMKELSGFNRRRWLTGFTNYRFAIPHYVGGAGRAIWNDVDQAYLADPAELFDAEMGDHGFLAIAPGGRTDTAVMLLDCARMAKVWTLEDAQHGHKNPLIAKTTAIPGLRGDLAPEWHARDEDFVPGRTKLLHWTILHTQPWRPLPQLFVYQHNPVGEVWHDMKRAADDAGYQVFTADRPSAQYVRLLTRLQAAAAESRPRASERPIGRGCRRRLPIWRRRPAPSRCSNIRSAPKTAAAARWKESIRSAPSLPLPGTIPPLRRFPNGRRHASTGSPASRGWTFCPTRMCRGSSTSCSDTRDASSTPRSAIAP